MLVRVTASGLCHSDLFFLQGVQQQSAAARARSRGRRRRRGGGARRSRAFGRRPGRSSGWVPGCGQCWFCRNGQSRLCTEPAVRVRRAESDEVATEARPAGCSGVGTFAEQALVREASLLKVETDLPDEQLALIGCGVTTGVGAALNTAAVRPGSTVAVVGCGGVGQSVIQGARIAGAARIIAIDPVELKRSVAAAMGATDTIDPTATDAVEEVRSLTGGRGVDYAFEVAGVEATLAQAFELTRPWRYCRPRCRSGADDADSMDGVRHVPPGEEGARLLLRCCRARRRTSPG